MANRTPFDEMDRTMTRMMSQMEQLRRAMMGRQARDDWGLALPSVPAVPSIPSASFADEMHAGSNLSVETDDDGYVVYADVPGFEREELDVTFDEGVLTISATHEVEDEHSHRSRTVHEQVSLPGEVAVDDITASYRNGVLEVHLPTVEETSDARRIDID